jgi:hypothetical protein
VSKQENGLQFLEKMNDLRLNYIFLGYFPNANDSRPIAGCGETAIPDTMDSSLRIVASKTFPEIPSSPTYQQNGQMHGQKTSVGCILDIYI